MKLLAILAVAVTFVKGQYRDPHCSPGRTVFTHLFEWRWDDIARECETFLGPYGYCGVQISPPSENALINNPYRPWWERYQPVSYKLTTRSGNEAQLADMVRRCRAVNVTVYADAVINHMTGASGSGVGTGGTTWNGGSLDYPGVPYTRADFNDETSCHSPDSNIHNYGNPEEVRNCRLVNLADLNLGLADVRSKVVAYLNHLISLGISGFRVDASKHMWPQEIRAILDSLNDIEGGQRPFIFQEVIDQGGEAIKADEYVSNGRITNFKFGLQLANVFRRQMSMKSLDHFGSGWEGMWPSDDVVNFVDNHDNQRGHGGGGGVVTFKENRLYKVVNAFMLAYPYGVPRVMSSFDFENSNQGPPHRGGDIAHVTYNDDMSCDGGWICEHRWREIYNMVAFRNVAAGQPVSNWWSGADYQIAFSRGNKAFIAINLEGMLLDEASLQTGLPAGTYCDVFSGNLQDGRCTGKSVTVGADGTAHVIVCANCEENVIALHVGARVGSPANRLG